MTTAEWLRSRIGPSPNPSPAERVRRGDDRSADFFSPYLRPDMRVLQAYCGTGRGTHALALSVPMGGVVGIDPDPGNLHRARARRVAGVAIDVSFERCALEDMPFGPGEFDAALISGPFSTAGSTERALEEVKRVLAPGGLLGVRHTVASSRVFSGRDSLLSRGLERRDAVLRDTGGDPDAGLRQGDLLREAGLVNMRVSGSVEQVTGDSLMSELSAGGFLVPISGSAEAAPGGEEDVSQVFIFTTAVETVCWKPA